MICEFGERLKTQIRSTDLAARLGGDEFVVLLTGINHEESALRIIDNIRQAMVRTWRFGDVTFTVSTSIGMTMPDENSTTSSVLKEADKAMYEEKEFKRGNVDDDRFSG
nr:GGDEF domain-containing protein [Planococcus versutus]